MPILIQGASGTGKKLVAELIYQVKGTGHFVPIDCGALSPSLFESELFGHERGAFTGAVQHRVGLLQSAHGGTAFFDEVGELSLESQAKLLRCIQQREVRSVGSNRSCPCIFRLIAATNRDLAEEVRQGRFRLDLFYRLNVVTLEVPSLSSRRSDIPQLVEYFLKRSGRPYEVPGEILDAMMAHEWPGNVRELENCVSRLVALSGDGRWHLEHLPSWHASPRIARRSPDVHVEGAEGHRYVPTSLDSMERSAINQAIMGTRRLEDAARQLGIGRRNAAQKNPRVQPEIRDKTWSSKWWWSGTHWPEGEATASVAPPRRSPVPHSPLV